jgi:N-formylmaleamate deformylase
VASLRLHDAVNEGLEQKWSPEQISARLDEDSPRWSAWTAVSDRERGRVAMTACTTSDHARGQSCFVELACGRFHYRVWAADRAAAVTVVFLHGNADSSAGWCRVASALAAEGTTAIALDLRGHGGSVKPRTGSYGLRPAADDVLAFITALRLDAPVLVGHCWGAAIALVLATGAYCDRTPPILAGLVLEELPPDMSVRSTPALLHGLLAAMRTPREVLEKSMTAWHSNWHPADREAMLDALCHADPDIAASVAQDGAEAGALLPLLTRVNVPAMMLWSDPRRGGVLDTEQWSLVGGLLSGNATARHLDGVSHDIHRGHYVTFMDLLKEFLCRAIQTT